MVEHIELGYEVEPKGTTRALFKQVHGATVTPIPSVEAAQALENSPPDADGAFTLSQHPVHVFTADCIPLLFFSPDPAGPVAAVHAGWRGVSLGIAAQTRRLLKGWDLEVWVGPHIGPCCFEVKDDLVQTFAAQQRDVRPFLAGRDGKTYLDLLGFLIEDQLQGVTRHRGEVRCTHCSEPTLPSYRRDGHTKRQIRSWIRKS